MTFYIFTGKDNQYYFNLKANNHEIVLRSEGYVNLAGAKNGVESVKENAPNPNRYDRLTSRNDQFYFNLKARNGEIIGTSEMYTTERARDHGIDVVMKGAPGARVAVG